MNCKGCLHNFDTRERKPLILIECGHSVCWTCLKQASEKVYRPNESPDLIKSKSLRNPSSYTTKKRRSGSQLRNKDQTSSILQPSYRIDQSRSREVRNSRSSALELAGDRFKEFGHTRVRRLTMKQNFDPPGNQLAGLCPECHTEFLIGRPLEAYPTN